MPQPADGVIKFELQHHSGALPAWADSSAIRHWFAACRELDLIGQHANRYGGAAYGNISQRAEQGFLITGSQTGGQPQLSADDIAWVTAFDVDANQLQSQGPIKPSSESLTHGQLYALAPEVNFIIHIHDKHLWEGAQALGLQATDAQAAYGTPQMAREVQRLMADPQVCAAGMFSMAGHEDGLVIFGESAKQAGERTLALYRRGQQI